jgi:hypothetical protein
VWSTGFVAAHFRMALLAACAVRATTSKLSQMLEHVVPDFFTRFSVLQLVQRDIMLTEELDGFLHTCVSTCGTWGSASTTSSALIPGDGDIDVSGLGGHASEQEKCASTVHEVELTRQPRRTETGASHKNRCCSLYGILNDQLASRASALQLWNIPRQNLDT